MTAQGLAVVDRVCFEESLGKCVEQCFKQWVSKFTLMSYFLSFNGFSF